jgi:hypothetical protein
MAPSAVGKVSTLNNFLRLVQKLFVTTSVLVLAYEYIELVVLK